MDRQNWDAWCLSVAKRLTNLEKTLKAYHKTQKRMLLILGLGFTAVLINGLLLYYK